MALDNRTVSKSMRCPRATGGRVTRRLRDDYGAEPEHKPRKLDWPSCSRSAATAYTTDDHQHRREQQHAQHLGDDRRVASCLADSTNRRQRLCHLVHGGAGVDAELALGETSQRVEHGIKEHGDGPKHHHRGHGYAEHLMRFAFDYAFRRKHRRRPTDPAARAYQQRSVRIQSEYSCAQRRSRSAAHWRLHLNRAPAHAVRGSTDRVPSSGCHKAQCRAATAFAD